MSIEKNIDDKQAAIDAERAASPTGSSAIADDLQLKAAAAVYGGSAEWDDYMREFALNEDELARLQPDDGELPSAPRNLARAYLVGNGLCGPESPGGVELSYTVGSVLDY